MHGLAVDTANACATACTAVDTAKHTTRDQDQGPGSRNRDHAGTPRARVLVYTPARGG